MQDSDRHGHQRTDASANPAPRLDHGADLCAYDFASNVMYAVLCAYTPEIFPTKNPCTGNALTAMANSVFEIMAPIVAIDANFETAAPAYVSGALVTTDGVIVTDLPN